MCSRVDKGRKASSQTNESCIKNRQIRIEVDEEGREMRAASVVTRSTDFLFDLLM